MQIIEQTEFEKTKMYMKCSKKELISMLIESNRILRSITPSIKHEVIDAPSVCSSLYRQWNHTK